ncbi:MAG: response regulator transcription factor [Candidatus Promineifilaceae bacterium]
MPTKKGKIQRVLIVDDNLFAREGMAVYLKRKGYECDEAADSAGALAVAFKQPFDAAIVDIVLPPKQGAPADMSGSEGINLARKLKQAYPQLGVVVFSAFNDRGREVLQLAADGTRGLAYMVKGAHPDRVLEALRATCDGQVVLGPQVLDYSSAMSKELWAMLSEEEAPWVGEAVVRCHELTEREMEVAELLAGSFTTQGIADALGISLKTVEKHTNRIYSKLRLSDVDRRDPPLRKALLLAKTCWLYELQEKSDR